MRICYKMWNIHYTKYVTTCTQIYLYALYPYKQWQRERKFVKYKKKRTTNLDNCPKFWFNDSLDFIIIFLHIVLYYDKRVFQQFLGGNTKFWQFTTFITWNTRELLKTTLEISTVNDAYNLATWNEKIYIDRSERVFYSFLYPIKIIESL